MVTGAAISPEQAAALRNTPKVLLTIILDPMNPNDVEVTGPLNNKMICYGMLEQAKQKIINWQPPAIALADGHQHSTSRRTP